MHDKFSGENLFDLDSLAKGHWRSRINAFKRELKASQGRPVMSTLNSRRRYNTRRRPARVAHSLP